ncbi:MAG: hypothetical protein FLDDKLPJ_00954 [Phycisphaerae bacterium]|nr:hypothetical protein [Phycisphaerae bacterium]
MSRDTSESPQRKGTCEACGKLNRSVRYIESGQWLCRTCLRELHPPRPKHLASLKTIENLRASGLVVGEDLPKDEADRLSRVLQIRGHGIAIHQDASLGELQAALRTIRKTITLGVRGESHRNPDGTDRQAIIRRCVSGEELHLIREPNNPYSARAVKVVRLNGEQIGYLPEESLGNDRGIGWCIADNMDRGVKYEARILEITGGYEHKKMRGVILELSYCPY